MKNTAPCFLVVVAVGFAACGGTSSKSDGGLDGGAAGVGAAGRGGTTGAGGGGGGAGGGGTGRGGSGACGTAGDGRAGGRGGATRTAGAGGGGTAGAAGSGTTGTAGAGGGGGGTAGAAGGGTTGTAGVGGAGRGGTTGSAGAGGSAGAAGAIGSGGTGGGAAGTPGTTATGGANGAGGTSPGRCTTPGDCGGVAVGVSFCSSTRWSCVAATCTAECMGNRTCVEAPDSGCLQCRTESSTTPMSQGCLTTACVFQAAQVRDVQRSSGCQAANKPDFSTWHCTGHWARLPDNATACTIQIVPTDAIRYSISCGSCVTVVTIGN